MTITEQDVKKISLITLIVLLGILVFLILKPVILSTIGGLLLAYIFFPVYKWTAKFVKSKSLAAALVSILVLLIIFVPLWFLIPLMSQQVFGLFQLFQELNINGLIRDLFPAASETFIAQINNTVNAAFSKITSSILDFLIGFFINFASIFLHLLLVAFVFFFALRDEIKLREFASGLSPLNKTQEANLVKQFKGITDSLVYGQIVIGLLAGLLAGLGFLIFGIPHALVLTVVAIVLGILPVIGVGLVYIPITIYLAVLNKPLLALGFLLYNAIMVSLIENVLRAHIVSKKTSVSQAIIFIGMVGGLFMFGVLGFLIGPLVLAYFLTFLEAYKNKTLSSLFREL